MDLARVSIENEYGYFDNQATKLAFFIKWGLGSSYPPSGHKGKRVDSSKSFLDHEMDT